MWTRCVLCATEGEFPFIVPMIVSLQTLLLSWFQCCDILVERLISVVLCMNSLQIEDNVGFIIKYCLEMERNLSISWCRQLVACHVGGLGSIQDQSMCSFWWTKIHWGSSCPRCQYRPVISPKSRVFYLPLTPYHLNNWQHVRCAARSHYYLPSRFFIFSVHVYTSLGSQRFRHKQTDDYVFMFVVYLSPLHPLLILWRWSPISGLSLLLFWFQDMWSCKGRGLSAPRPTPKLKDQLSLFMTSGDRMAQLYP